MPQETETKFACYNSSCNGKITEHRVREVLKLNFICVVCGEENDSNPKWKEKAQELEQSLTQLEAELATERETTQQALQTSQEWHERQKAEIIAEWKGKLTNLTQQRKTQINQELTLLRQALNSHD